MPLFASPSQTGQISITMAGQTVRYAVPELTQLPAAAQ